MNSQLCCYVLVSAASIIALVHVGSASATAASRCWVAPEPKSLVEAGHMSENDAQFAARRARVRQTQQPAALVLSDGALRSAYSAGLLVGWAETGQRPDFDMVTAVGPSVLVAPFAFLGRAGDQSIADVFGCPSESWQHTADRAADLVTAGVLAAIAARHRAGKRLLVAVKGNAARPSAYWDLGWIAANTRPADAKRKLRLIFHAGVTLHHFPDTPVIPSVSGIQIPRNRHFRQIGSGRAFLLPSSTLKSIRSLYIIHNDVLLPDESAAFRTKLAAQGYRPTLDHRVSPLRTIYDVKSIADQLGKHYRIITIKPRKWFFPKGAFDRAYMQDVFVRSHRSARMGKLWSIVSGK